MAAPLDEIRLLYRQQQYLDCLLRFHQLIESLGPDPNSSDIAQLTPLWCDLFHGRQCLLMKAARLADRSKRVEDLLQAITGLFGGLRGQQFAPAVEQLDPAPEFLLARLDILTVLLDPPAVNANPEQKSTATSNTDRLRFRLEQAITAYAAAWSLDDKPWDCEPLSQQQRQEHEPTSLTKNLVPRTRDTLRAIARELPLGWHHPGLLAVCDTMAWWYSSDAEVQSRGTKPDVTTFIAFAPTRIDLGVLGQLTIERLPGGIGRVYPDPILSGDWRLDSEFANGIRHACLAAEIGPMCEYDFRWTIDLLTDDTHLPLVGLPLAGRSAEAAFACALQAAMRDEPLDPQIVVTAQLWDPQNGDFRLQQVDGVLAKAYGVHQVRRLKHAQVDEILVAAEQPEFCDVTRRAQLPPAISTGHIKLDGVATFHDAYERMSRYTLMTRAACASIAVHEEAFLRKNCGVIDGRINYVQSALSRKPTPEELRNREPSDNSDRWIELSDAEVAEVMHGRMPAGTAIRLIADSGLGKTTLLAHSTYQIATLNDGRLPLKLDDHSEYDWRTPSTLIENLSQSLQVYLAPLHYPHAKEWLERLITRGQVVFLLDALDQTKGSLKGFKHLFEREKGHAGNCPVLLTGRKSVLTGKKSRAFDYKGREWQTLRVEPFDEPRQRQYLGDAAERLLPNEKHSWERPEDFDRWAYLLGIPLLLSFLKQLAHSEQLSTITSRYLLYARAVGHLFNKGEESLAQTNLQANYGGLSGVVDELQKIAWYMVKAQNFTGHLSGVAWNKLRKKLGDAPIERLTQINILTADSVLDRADAAGLAWRHRSFLEFFAGIRLATLSADRQTKIIQQYAQYHDWQWVFRFALSAAAEPWRDGSREIYSANATALEHLACCLIRYGNPFVVYESIVNDNLPGLDEGLETLSRWLIHRDQDGSDAWTEGKPLPTTDDDTLEILADVFDHRYRDSRVLHPAWELLTASDSPHAKAIRDEFLGEFARLVEAERQRAQNEPGFDRQKSPVLQLVPEEELLCLHELEPAARMALVQRDLNWRSCPPDPLNDLRSFWRGSRNQGEPSDSKSQKDERPAREITITPFIVQSGLVTNAQYALFDPSRVKFQDEYSSDTDQPVHQVNWYMAEMFTIWLTGRAGSATDATKDGSRVYRLPTEAEWEFACRAGTQTPFAIGNGLKLTENDANFGGRPNVTTPAGSYCSNSWGIYDTHGNLWEWCGDWYNDDYFIKSPRVDPTGPSTGATRVLRGGAFFAVPVSCRAANRGQIAPISRSSGIGIRVAVSRRLLGASSSSH